MDDVVRDWDGLDYTDLEKVVAMTGEWRRSKGFETGWKNFAEKLMLVITEGTEAMDALDGVMQFERAIRQPDLATLNNSSQKLILHLDNYAEEWIDVMVRLFDIIDACDLMVDVIKPYDGDMENGKVFSLSLEKIYTVRGHQRFEILCRALSGAMEAFRDVKLYSPSKGDEEVGKEDKGNVAAIKLVSECVSSAVLIAAHALQDVGLWWPKPYALKMKINESRPSKHGRER